MRFVFALNFTRLFLLISGFKFVAYERLNIFIAFACTVFICSVLDNRKMSVHYNIRASV